MGPLRCGSATSSHPLYLCGITIGFYSIQAISHRLIKRHSFSSLGWWEPLANIEETAGVAEEGVQLVRVASVVWDFSLGAQP